MTVRSRACPTMPLGEARRRIVDAAVREWAFFGFRSVDRTVDPDQVEPRNAPRTTGAPSLEAQRNRARPSRLGAEGAARAAATIAGYWAVTPEGPWIVEQQNQAWNGPAGLAVRWQAPWSAAFVSWVMCEAGLGGTDQFQRAIAHHVYIDQAIRSRDGRAPRTAFVAYDAGEAAVIPGDLLCTSRRPAYRSIAERRRQLGVGARGHCDVVVSVDEARERILAIGGNVRDAVTLKLLPAFGQRGKPLQPLDTGEDDRPMFAHLRLRADPIEANALEQSPSFSASGCAVASVPVVSRIAVRC